MASWWKLRTQVLLVLGILLSLIAFLGAYALSEAHRYANETNELLNISFRSASMLKEISNAQIEKNRVLAKYKATRDQAYRSMAHRLDLKTSELLGRLQKLVHKDESLVRSVNDLIIMHSRRTRHAGPRPEFLDAVSSLEQRLDGQGSRRVETVRAVAQDLAKIILVAFLVAIGVTTWLGWILYYAVLHPIENIKAATRRIREGELSCRVERHGGFDELKALSREFNAMAGRIEELDKMKSEFLSTVSHELKTPLTALKEGLAFLSEKNTAMPPAIYARTLEVCNQSTKRLETMIENLLNHARMESGFYHFDGTPKNFVGVVENAILGVRPIAERRKQAIVLEAETPQISAAFSSDGMTHVIENLLLNAVKYGDSAHPIKVRIAQLDDAPVGRIEVRVSNHGKGLLPSELTRVFDRFFRGSNSDGQKGVGLGLSVVKRIVQAHHGEVVAESADGVTTFRFHIPQHFEAGMKGESQCGHG